MADKKSKVESLKQSQRDRRADLAAWRASRTHELTLPSGLTVMVTDVTITDLLFSGKLPPAIMVMAEQEAKNGKQTLDLEAISQNAPEFAELVNAVVRIAVKEPLIADQSDDDHITLDELNGDDRLIIFQFINRETAAVQPFRDEKSPVQDGRAGAQVLEETQ